MDEDYEAYKIYKQTKEKENHNLDSALTKLDDLIKSREMPVFTKEEAETLKEIAVFWKGLETLGKITKLLKTLLMGAGYVVLFWYASKTGLVEWLKLLIK